MNALNQTHKCKSRVKKFAFVVLVCFPSQQPSILGFFKAFEGVAPTLNLDFDVNHGNIVL
jgi:hypothetical protein